MRARAKELHDTEFKAIDSHSLNEQYLQYLSLVSLLICILFYSIIQLNLFILLFDYNLSHSSLFTHKICPFNIADLP